MENNQIQELSLKKYKDKLINNLQKLKKEYFFDPKSLIDSDDSEIKEPYNKFIEKSKNFMNSSMK